MAREGGLINFVLKIRGGKTEEEERERESFRPKSSSRVSFFGTILDKWC